MAGKTYGRLTGISYEGNFRWKFMCSCGSVIITRGVDVRKGKSLSCGCGTREATIRRCTTHGHCRHPEYHVWRGIKQRCENPHHRSYHRYGGRGISICAEWSSDFAAFFRDMGERPEIGFTVERVDNNGPYSKQNCVWATPKQQAQNRRTSHFITHDGQTLTIAQWADKTGVGYATICGRIRAGKTGEALFRKPSFHSKSP